MSRMSPETAHLTLESVSRTQSVRTRLLVLLGTSLLIMFVVIGLSVYFLLFRFEQGMWHDRQQEAAHYSSQITGSFLRNVENSLAAIAAVAPERIAARPEEVQNLLLDEPALLEVIRLDQQGKPLASAYRDLPVLTNQFTVSQSDWFLKAAGGQRYLGEVQVTSNDQPSMIVAVPAEGGGVAAARLSMTVLWNLMSELKYGATGVGYVVDRDGHIIAHSDPAIVLANTKVDLQTGVGVGNSLEPYLNFAGTPVVGTQLPVEGTDWTLVSEVSQAEAFATSRTAPFLITAGLLLLGVVTVFATSRLLTRIILRPLTVLQAGAARVGQGDLDHRINLTSADEIGYTAGAFNLMADRLSDTLDSLETRVEMRTAQVEASADVGRAATAILDPDLLLKQVVNLITERLGMYYAAAFTLDPAGQYAVLREASGPGDAVALLKQAEHQLDLSGNSIVAACIREQHARVAQEANAEAIRFANPLLSETRSELALPLRVGNQVIGALDVQSVQAADFDETSTSVLQNMADQIAIALNNAVQYRREQTRAQQTTHLLEATVELTAFGQTSGLHDRVVDLTAALLNADSAGLWQPLVGDELIMTHATDGLHPLLRHRVPSGEGITGRVHATALTLRLDNVRAWQDAAIDLGDLPVRAVLAVPMIWQGQVIGVLMAAHTDPGRTFSADDGNAAQLFAGQAASALENVRLLDRLQGTLTELSAANKRLTSEAWQTRMRGQEIAYDYRRAIEAGSAAPTLTMNVPIELRGQTIGSLTLEDDQAQRQLSADERELVQEVVQRMALALENARLFEQTQTALSEARRLAQRERLINRITAQLRGAATVDEVLRIAADEMRHSMHATWTAAELKLVDPSAGGSSGNDQGGQYA